jgi:hypothetical protein
MESSGGQMTAHLTMAAAAKLGLLAEFEKGIHTFSNGSEWDSWASQNCYRCQHYIAEPDKPDEGCALEFSAMLQQVSPELARWFGWVESERYAGSFHYPRRCPHFRLKDDRDEDREFSPAPDPDPAQLVLIADPTEDAALIQNAPVVELPPVAAGPPGSGQ